MIKELIYNESSNEDRRYRQDVKNFAISRNIPYHTYIHEEEWDDITYISNLEVIREWIEEHEVYKEDDISKFLKAEERKEEE